MTLLVYTLITISVYPIVIIIVSYVHVYKNIGVWVLLQQYIGIMYCIWYSGMITTILYIGRMVTRMVEIS